MTKAINCVAYKGRQRPGDFLYVDSRVGLTQVPDALQAMMGELSHVVTFPLTPQRKLAQADAAKVYAQIRSDGYYLQVSKQDREKECLGNYSLPEL
jgi:uncharacterized protein YcgL (UPF0745 family)